MADDRAAAHETIAFFPGALPPSPGRRALLALSVAAALPAPSLAAGAKGRRPDPRTARGSIGGPAMPEAGR